MARELFTNRLFLSLLMVMGFGVLTVSAHEGCAEESATDRNERIAIATLLLRHHGVKTLDFHVSGVSDQATARQNLQQAAAGKHVKRSGYGNAPGGDTQLDLRMLRALLVLVYEGYEIRLTELAGGSHSCNSRHYVGVGFDVDFLDGKKIKYGHPTYRRFLRRCRELGATEVLGPGDRGHSTHLHVAWPRK